MVNSHLVCDPTIQQPGFNLPRQQWSLLNRFCTEQRHCRACRRKWRLTDTDLCPCGETQMMSHIVEYCPLTKLNGGLSRLHSADEDAVSWLTSDQSWFMTRLPEEDWHMGKHITKRHRQSSWSMEKAVACKHEGKMTSLWTSAKLKPARFRSKILYNWLSFQSHQQSTEENMLFYVISIAAI